MMIDVERGQSSMDRCDVEFTGRRLSFWGRPKNLACLILNDRDSMLSEPSVLRTKSVATIDQDASNKTLRPTSG
jgi:hypothetical protein